MKPQFSTNGILGLALVVLFAGITASAETRYVWQGSPRPSPPHTNWATAAHTIQKAVDAAEPGDTVLVTNGVYATGGRAVFGLMTNRVAIDRRVSVRSVNGPEVTVIQGYQVPGTRWGDGAIRCAWLMDGALLSGFTLTNGATRSTGDEDHELRGGGTWCASEAAVVSNCILTGNAAGAGGAAAYGTLSNCSLTGNWAGNGGGAWGCNLLNCRLIGNTASAHGGGADRGTLRNCSLADNTALNDSGGGVEKGSLYGCVLSGNRTGHNGGGAHDSWLNHCILTNNYATNHGGGAYDSALTACILVGNSSLDGGGGAWLGELRNCIAYYNSAGGNYGGTNLIFCCTTPLPANGSGNSTNEPGFVNRAGGNLRLQSGSPCINAGNNAYVTNSTDLDGRPRIVGGTVDIGAYEYQGAGMSKFIGWLQQYGLPTDGSADTTDPDGDGLNNWQEWRCRTDPTNALSILRVLPPVAAGSNVNVSWQSVNGLSYFLERSKDLSASPPFRVRATNLIGQTGTTTYTDTNAAGAVPRFYRVGVPGP